MSGKHECGFTLFELLMCVAIIAILVSFLTSGFRTMRYSASNILCQNNIRQMGLGTLSWSHDNRGMYPPPIFPHYGATFGLDTFDVVIARQLELSEGSMRKIIRCPFDKEPEWRWYPGGPTVPRRSYSTVLPLVGSMASGWYASYVDPRITKPYRPSSAWNPYNPGQLNGDVIVLGDFVNRNRRKGADVNASLGFGGGSLQQSVDWWMATNHPWVAGKLRANVLFNDLRVGSLDYGSIYTFTAPQAATVRTYLPRN
jgi:prepilin-type N-terminal cleavage/methylation domain-containing protein